MSFARDIAKKAGAKNVDISPPEKANLNRRDAKTVLGFVLATAEETIISDLIQMLRENKVHSLEGYVLCLARVVNHDESWLCISEAFRTCNAPIPDKYYTLFGKTRDTLSSKPHIKVQ